MSSHTIFAFQRNFPTPSSGQGHCRAPRSRRRVTPQVHCDRSVLTAALQRANPRCGPVSGGIKAPRLCCSLSWSQAQGMLSSTCVLGKPQSNPAPNEAAVWGWQTPGNGTGCADSTLPLAIQGPKSCLDRALQGARDLLGSRSLSGCQELFALRGQGQWKSSPHANNMKTLQRTFLVTSVIDGTLQPTHQKVTWLTVTP